MTRARDFMPEGLKPERDTGDPYLPAVSYSPELGRRICFGLAQGIPVYQICQMPGMPHRGTVFSWILEHEDFAAEYFKARKAWAEAQFDEIFQIADNTQEGQTTTDGPKGIETKTGDMIEHRKLRVSARQWGLSRIFPERYGERTNHQMLDEKGKPTKPPGITIVIDASPK